MLFRSGADEVSEDDLLEALQIAHDEIKKLCDVQDELRKLAGKPKWDVAPKTVDPDMLKKVEKAALKQIEEATLEQGKLERRDKIAAAKAAAQLEVIGEEPTSEQKAQFSMAFDQLIKRTIRRRIAVEKHRPDGRKADEIRPIWCDTSIAPRTHGSGLFTRGETQVLTLLALGTMKEAQRIDDLSIDTTKRYIHHYNFPPFSVGEKIGRAHV